MRSLRKYRLRFDPAVELVRTGDLEADIQANTQKFTSIIEDVCEEVSGAVAVGAPEVEDAAAGGESVVLMFSPIRPWDRSLPNQLLQ